VVGAIHRPMLHQGAMEGTSMSEVENDMSVNCVEEKDTLLSSVTRGLIGTTSGKIKVHQLLCRHLMILIQLGMRIQAPQITSLQTLRK
jgi:hypothetical protein